MSAAMLALGAGLQSFGSGMYDLQRNQEAMKARQAEQDEQRRFRAEQSQFQRDQQAELRRSRRRAELQGYWAQQGVVLSPDRLNALIEAEEQEQGQAAMMATVPTGDEPMAPAQPRAADAMSEIARRALEASRGQQGARVQMDDNWGFAQDEQALRASQAAALQAQRDAEAAERAREANETRRAIAALAATSRGSGQGGSTADALTRVERQIDDTRSDLGQVRLQMPRESEFKDALTGEIDRAGLNAARAPFQSQMNEFQQRSDSLGFVRDSLVSEVQGRGPLRRPTAPQPQQPTMDPAQADAMKRELNEVATEVAAILNDPRATAEEKAEARALLQQEQTAIARRYQSRRPSNPVGLRPVSQGRPSTGADPRGAPSIIGVRTQAPNAAADTPFTPTGANIPGARRIERADAMGPNAPKGTLDAMVALATGVDPRLVSRG